MYNSNLLASNASNTLNSVSGQGSVPLLRKRRPIGRRKRSIFISAENRNATHLLEDEIELAASPDPAEMYYAMIQCAEDYTKFYYIK